MICLKRSHKDELEGVKALRETIDFLESKEEVAQLSVIVLQRENEMLRERIEELKAELAIYKFGPNTAALPPAMQPGPAEYPHPNPTPQEPVNYGDLNAYIRVAELAEAKLAAEERRQAAIEAAKERE